MPTNIESIQVVKNHRQHYLDRKLARSPLLHFFQGAYRIDVNQLFHGINQNLPASEGLAGVSTPESLIKNLLGNRLDATIHQNRPSLIKKLEKIFKAAQDSRLSTGQHTLYLGYPCAVLPGESGKTKLAPILLFAVDLTVSSQKITIKRRLELDDSQAVKIPTDAIFNRLLASYIEREYGVLIGKDIHEVTISGNDIGQVVDQIFSDWKAIKSDFNYPNVSETPDRQALKLLDNETSDPYIADYAILGIAEFTGQAMLDDLDKIIKMMESGTECPEALKSIIDVAQNNSDNEGFEPQSDQSKWLVEKSDPSQEKVIWTQKVNFLTVLQGPPGTGKSQTIVNIVADALAQKKTVLVVCQKRAAIEVVLKRLTAKGLGEIAVLVDDVDKDRLRVIRKLDQIEEDFKTSIYQIAERKRLSDDIQAIESNIDAAIVALNDQSDGTRYRYADIKALLKRLSMLDPSIEWTSQLKQSVKQYLEQDIHKNHLNEFIQQLKAFDLRAQNLAYGQNKWSEADDALSSNPLKLEQVVVDTKIANQLTKSFMHQEIATQHDMVSHWIAGHPWLQNTESVFQANSLLSDSTNRDSFSHFQRWLASIQNIAEVNPSVNKNNLIEQLLDKTLDIKYFEHLEQDAKNLRDIVALRSELKQHIVTECADKFLPHKRGDWASDIHAIALHKWWRDLLSKHGEGFHHAANITSLAQQLKQKIDQKRMADSSDVLAGFDSRVDARNTLKNHNLLRLRAGGGVPKTSLRRLYSSGLGELNKISPLLLASPETASSMLPLKSGLFDVVVIDEASQMFVAEAIPMLFRGKRVVIAGDTMQMPPSDFFAYAEDDDEVYESENEDDLNPQQHIAADRVYPLLEAAEDALPAGGFSKLRLEVHYRSARKELIDFSNHAFYEGKLIIPSGNSKLPVFMKTAVEFENVKGEFNKGINELEAKRVVEILQHIWKLPEAEKPTVGVIVANVKQRDRIRELLQDAANKDEAFSRVYEAESERTLEDEDVSFFVRSVEHVQGDERDLIILGFTYSGNSRSFGPLKDKNDGRKRLNVAITRSKRGMIILNSLNVSHVSNAAEKDSHERYYVWQYLRYAKAVAQEDFLTIDSVLNQLNQERQALIQKLHETDSPFEDEVKEFLESQGYYVECQIGESGFRIDLGVKLKPNSANYLCGLECDGARYHSGWRARTNDVWRQEILESKGWSILRVWSTDWFDKPEITQKQLLEKLDAFRALEQNADNFSSKTFINRLSEKIDFSSEVVSEESASEVVNIAKNTTHNSNNIAIEVGDTIRYELIDSGTVAEIKLVNGVNDVASGSINKNTPLAKAMIDSGAGEGDVLMFLSPTGNKELRIISIQKPTA